MVNLSNKKNNSWYLKPSKFGSRLDAEYNLPIYIENEEKLLSTGSCTKLKEIEKCGSYGVLPDSDEYGTGSLPLIRGKDLTGKSLNEIPTETPKIPEKYLNKGKARVSIDDVLLLIKGATIDAPQSVAVVSRDFPLPAIVNGSIYKFSLKDGYDPYFICAYMGSKYGLLQKKRSIANTGIFYNDQNEIRNFLISTPIFRIQQAIGNKIRKGERLEIMAKEKKDIAIKIIDNELNITNIENSIPKLNTWISLDNLENRLDGKYNSPERLWVLNHLKRNKIKYSLAKVIFEVSAMIGWKGLTTEHYTSAGPYLIRGVDIEDGTLNTKNMVRVEIEKYLEQPQIHLEHGDIVLTKDGTIGKTLTIPKLHEKMCASSTVARLRNKSDIPPYYYEAILNHPLLQIQIQSFATGLAQPHITQEWIAELQIPIIPSNSKVGNLTKQHHDFVMVSKKYIENAKSDIEALIEGTLDEEKLFEEGEEIEQWLKENPSPYQEGRNEL